MHKTFIMRSGMLRRLRHAAGLAVFFIFLATGALAGHALSLNASVHDGIAPSAPPRIPAAAEAACRPLLDAAPASAPAGTEDMKVALVSFALGVRYTPGETAAGPSTRAAAVAAWRQCLKEKTLKNPSS